MNGVQDRLISADAAFRPGTFLAGNHRDAVFIVYALNAQTKPAILWGSNTDLGNARVFLHALEHFGFFFSFGKRHFSSKYVPVR